MKTIAALLLPSLLVACTGCGTIALHMPTDPIYGIVSLRELPVGHVIKESDVTPATQVRTSHRDLLHPFRARPDTGEFTTDASKIVGHTVKTLILAHQIISPQRDLN